MNSAVILLGRENADEATCMNDGVFVLLRPWVLACSLKNTKSKGVKNAAVHKLAKAAAITLLMF